MEQEDQAKLNDGTRIAERRHSDLTASGGSHGPCTRFLIWLVRAYQATLSSFMGGHCRFQPTCSVYSIDALKQHGAMRGTWLTIRRLSRCHPLGGFGYDPVPPSSDAKPEQATSDSDEERQPS